MHFDARRLWCGGDHSKYRRTMLMKNNEKEVLDLIYWRDPKKSAVVLSVSIILLLIFAKFPLISVLSYLGLAVLGGTLGFRLYKIAEAQLKKSDGANPFQ
uniref:Reticulon-like protein n=1 Tax=Ascaris lumbricoides TaxID=6252 RepID=A0A0M3HIZ1_ASCLU